MKRIAAFLASAALGALLVGSGPASAQTWSDMAWRYPYNPGNYAYNYGYPYNYAYSYGYPSYAYGYGYGYPYANSYDYANPFAIVTAPIAALAAPATPFEVATSAARRPLLTGRSVATGQMGKMCSTPVRACELYHASYIGDGCSCRVSGGRSRGTVSP